MATIKAFSDLEQSKKLAEILPLESADMFYKAGNDTQPIFILHSYGHIMSNNDIPTWSLAALLKVLDFPSLTQNKEDEWEVRVFDHDIHGYIEKTASNPVDACVAMIENLHELNLL